MTEFYSKKTSVDTTGRKLATTEKVVNQVSNAIHQPRQEFDLSIFEVVDGKVNLTKVCQYFGKNINDWTKTKQTKAFLAAFTRSKAETNIIVSLKGGSGEQGSFTQYREVALKLAQWISPDFEVWCIEQIDTLFQTGKVELQPAQQQSLDIRMVARQLLDELDKKDLVIQEKNQIIEEQRPAVQFKEAVSNSINSITVADFAKIIGSGEIKFYSWLREKGYLQFHPKNRPYQEFIDRGYFKVIEKTYSDQSTGESKTYFQTLITGKGQEYLTKKWQNQTNQIINISIGEAA